MNKELKIEENKEKAYQSGSLIIEENTIYEIDEDCLDCLEKERNRGTK